MIPAQGINGKMHTLQDDGSRQEGRCAADWAKVDAQTEVDMRRFT